MSCVPSSATIRRFKPTSLPLALDKLVTDEPWIEAVERFRTRNPRRRDRIAAYEQILTAGQHLRIGEDVLHGSHWPAPPVEGWLNKADGRKKRVFQYPPADELLFRVLNRLLQAVAGAEASPWCRSFLAGGGARAAFRGVLADRTIDTKAALRLDIRDYFNSIDVDDLLASLPQTFGSGPVGTLLGRALLDPRVERDGAVVDGGQKGVMAGTPVAPLLATLYLRDLDRDVAAEGVTYARYSDDILVCAPPADLPALEHFIRWRLNQRGLRINEGKSGVAAPGAPWDFLGFRYERGAIGLAPITERKLKAKSTRLARSLLRWRERNDARPSRAVGAFVRRTNHRVYGVPTERAEFSWATWFLPMLNEPDRLAGLDEHVQREARYAATGRRTASTRRALRYSQLVEMGYLPLVAAYWAMREGPATYDTLVGRRTGLGAVGVVGAGGAGGAGGSRVGLADVLGDRAGQLGLRRVVESGQLQHD
jgi:hypothetical protein